MHRWASTSTSISAISDIRHRHLLFRYRKKICRTENCHSDIGRVPISTSESIPISDIQKIFITSAGFEPKTLVFSATVLIYEFLDFGYRIKVYSDIRYNVGLRSLQSDIGSSYIKLSPISLITDIGVSAHLWLYVQMPWNSSSSFDTCRLAPLILRRHTFANNLWGSLRTDPFIGTTQRVQRTTLV
jgi:hypothetical protein